MALSSTARPNRPSGYFTQASQLVTATLLAVRMITARCTSGQGRMISRSDSDKARRTPGSRSMGRSEGRIFAAILRDVTDNQCVSDRLSLKAIAGVWLALLACFIALALRASTGEALGIDVTLERWVQSLPSVTG